MNPTRVLIVDDDDDIRANFSDILQDFGFITKSAPNAESALSLIRDDEFDVVLLDYKMPGMDGASLYQEIKKVRPSTAAIMITAWAGDDGIKRAINAGTWEVMHKPVAIPELLDKIREVASAPVVLLVDDDRAFCDSLWQVLNEQRIRVALAHTEEDGIHQIQAHSCDIAIVDMKLGAGDGRNVIRKLFQTLPKARAIVVTGCPNTAVTVAGELGNDLVSAVCSKPIDIENLLEKIRNHSKN